MGPGRGHPVQRQGVGMGLVFAVERPREPHDKRRAGSLGVI